MEKEYNNTDAYFANPITFPPIPKISEIKFQLLKQFPEGCGVELVFIETKLDDELAYMVRIYDTSKVIGTTMITPNSTYQGVLATILHTIADSETKMEK